jgi:hypothetical protein
MSMHHLSPDQVDIVLIGGAFVIGLVSAIVVSIRDVKRENTRPQSGQHYAQDLDAETMEFFVGSGRRV